MKIIRSSASVPFGFLLLWEREPLIYFVSFRNTRAQAGDAFSMLGHAFDLELLLAV